MVILVVEREACCRAIRHGRLWPWSMVGDAADGKEKVVRCRGNGDLESQKQAPGDASQ